MSGMKIVFKRFIRPQFLKRMGRAMLTRFFEEFAGELAAANLALPTAALDDAAFFGGLARLLAAPEQLPDRLNEALFAIDELSTPEGQEQLETALARSGVPLEFEPGSSRADLVLQAWLAAPEVVVRTHNRQRLRRLSTFEYFSAGVPGSARPPFTPPDAGTLAALSARLDQWFARHQRGHNTTRCELYSIDAEYWFLVRHGDTFSRTPKVEAQQTEILHFRPERDDVVVYSPRLDEIRINARTRGERELYVRQFGQCLRGSEDYFSCRSTYSLEPLRVEGPDALDTAGLEGIRKIVLRELEVAWDTPEQERTILEASDLFAANGYSGRGGLEEVLAPPGRLARAGFDIHFHDSARPRPVQIRLPNILKLGRHADARRVEEWLEAKGFRAPTA